MCFWESSFFRMLFSHDPGAKMDNLLILDMPKSLKNCGNHNEILEKRAFWDPDFFARFVRSFSGPKMETF